MAVPKKNQSSARRLSRQRNFKSKLDINSIAIKRKDSKSYVRSYYSKEYSI